MENQVKCDIQRWKFEIKQARERAKVFRQKARDLVSGPIGTTNPVAALGFKIQVGEEMARIRDRQNAISEAKNTLKAVA